MAKYYMRELLTIVESYLSDASYLIDDVNAVFAENGASEATPEEILKATKQFESSFTASDGIVYRFLRLPSEMIASLKAGDALGSYWTTDEDIPLDGLWDDHQYPDGKQYKITAQCSIQDVDEPRSIAARISWPAEHEVFIQKYGRLRLISLSELDGQDDLRPELIGQYFVA